MNTPKPSPAPGVVQTTIDSATTTINPGTTIHNRVEPGGAPHAETTETATIPAAPMVPAAPKV